MESYFSLTQRAEQKRRDFEAEIQMHRAVRQLPRASRSGRPAIWRLLVSLPLKDFVLIRARSRSVSPAKREIAQSDDAAVTAG